MTAQEGSQGVAKAATQRSDEDRSVPLWRRPFTWLIVLVGLAFALLPAWGDNVQLRESLLLAAVYITLGQQPEHHSRLHRICEFRQHRLFRPRRLHLCLFGERVAMAARR